MIYLDNAATARPFPGAAAAAHAAMAEGFGNPSSVHTLGRQAREGLESARRNVADLLGCAAKCVTFTSGGTESINTALQSAAAKGRRRGTHIVSTEIEHDAVLAVLASLKNQGFSVTLVPPEPDGTVREAAMLNALRDDTILVSMQAVNNETGARLPYGAVAAALKRRNPRAAFHLDAVQALGEEVLDLKSIDFASVSGHKIGGIKGSGALYMAPAAKLRPLLLGGGQENNLRSGTEAMPAIAAFGAAATWRLEHRNAHRAHLSALRTALLQGLETREVRFRLNSPEGAAPHIVSLSVAGAPSEVYIRLLSDAGICVSGGSACKRGKRSHVLASMKMDSRDIDSTLRVSLSPLTEMAEIEAFIDTISQLQKTFP